ncbi:MAG: hypothetical protein JSW06_09365 [Thermoplasmatales archaeon]|nr:MAG: hypothetical protein JSW06_09365 [Thermoplasmatales archaeon]
MKKKLIIGSLFAILMLLFPMISAVEINTNVKPLDEYTEKISFIKGRVIGYNRTGFSINISYGNITIVAYTTNGFYTKNTNHVYIRLFLGFLYSRTGGYPVGRYVWGFAIGNIEW